MRVNIEEQGRQSPRFRISETGIGLEESQLKPYEIVFNKLDESKEDNYQLEQDSEDGLEHYQFVIHQKPFRVTQIVNGLKAMEVNVKDTLFI